MFAAFAAIGLALLATSGHLTTLEFAARLYRFFTAEGTTGAFAIEFSFGCADGHFSLYYIERYYAFWPLIKIRRILVPTCDSVNSREL